ncbi:hypothetical protein [Chitinophaga polysaccharea]|uniref:hypothetical protein n=1 Tax=Chitinophaga polysaccharea TaxID=1293035 RepID=UPI00115B7371|nr:hypothetical protein [Chitinophaga polysaccharea]
MLYHSIPFILHIPASLQPVNSKMQVRASRELKALPVTGKRVFHFIPGPQTALSQAVIELTFS